MVSTRRERRSQPPPPPHTPATTSTSSDLKRWEVIFKALKKMLKQQASQIETLLEERTLLQERLQLQHQCWNSDVRLLEDTLSQKERQLELSELEKLFEARKAQWLLSSKQREALINKLKLEHAWSELDDFKAWFDILSRSCPDKEDISPGRLGESLKAKAGGYSISKDALMHHSELEKEVAMLKHKYENDLSGLKDENHFVWNQYKMMEASYTDQLKTKNDELNEANHNITNLLKSVEQLQSEKVEKDDKAATLRVKITELEAEVIKKDEDISRLSKEFELLRTETTDAIRLLTNSSSEPSSSLLKNKLSRRKERAALEEEESELLRSKPSVGMPVLKRCMNEPSSTKMRGRGNGRNGRTASVEENVSFTQREDTIVILALEDQANQINGEISALSKELELLKSKSVADTPVSKNCSSRPSSSRSRGRTIVKDRESASLKERESSSQLVSVQGSTRMTRSKRNQDDVISTDDPRLFTSQFKIPKLKIQSPHER